MTLDQYYERLAAHLPNFSPAEQRGALALYRQLAEGRPVDLPPLSPALEAFAYRDRQGRVIGFGGLAVAPMHHRFEVDGRPLWTWCAWDSLFIPELLGVEARVVSSDPMTGRAVELVVGPGAIERADPPETVVSFLRPDAGDFDTSAANVMAKFCHFVFFFESPAQVERWRAEHPGTIVFSLDQAFVLARRANHRTFGTELARRERAAPGGSAPRSESLSTLSASHSRCSTASR